MVLAGGSGTRLYPCTIPISKQLLPIYDKPMIYYPVSVLMLAEIRDILIISSSQDLPVFKRLFGTGDAFGVKFDYLVQDRPEGIAQALILGEEFIDGDNTCLILGDNLFYGQKFSPKLKEAKSYRSGATLFGYQVRDPHRFGVVEFDEQRRVLSIEEKPRSPKSNFAVTGLYFYDNKAVNLAKTLTPSARGELEITALNNLYLDSDEVRIQLLSRGFSWLDTGTHESLIEAGQFVQTMEKYHGFKVACLEEIAWRNGWLGSESLVRCAKNYGENNAYGRYLVELVQESQQC